MACWLFKDEPENTSWESLVKAGQTLWEGVNNALAKKHLAAVRPGDRILLYHTGKVKAIIGELMAVKSPNEELVCVEVVQRWDKEVSLAAIKQEAQLREWELVRLPRLSVMPVSEEIWKKLEEMKAKGDLAK
jgi:predicted RNA-binding protein with PUA-like domain